MGDELVKIVEAIYAIERGGSEWLEKVMEAARPSIERGLGLFAYRYGVEGTRVVAQETVTCGDTPMTRQRLVSALAMVPPDYAARAWTTCKSSTASEIEGWNAESMRASRDVFRRAGIVDVFCVNGFDPTAGGTSVAVPLSAETRVADRQRRRWTRVGHHLAAASRLRERIAGRPAWLVAEAVFTPGGRLAHAAGDARRASARDSLREAVLALDRLRTSRERRDGDAALAQWPVRIGGRWSLVDAFDSDGRRYVVAVADETVSALTEREREVLSRAATGHSNKVIAYELGLSSSTVRVLLSRAATKLGVRRREEAVALYRASHSNSTTKLGD